MPLNKKRITRRAMVRGGTLLVGSAILPAVQQTAVAQSVGSRTENLSKQKGVMLMNRIAPSSSDLYIANADGSGERKFLHEPAFDYNACFVADGRSVVFTSERNGDGNSDLFRCRVNGTGIEPLVAGPAVDDAGDLSSDGSRLAFVSTRNGYRANIWVMDLRNGAARNLTGVRRRSGRDQQPEQLPASVLVARRKVARLFLGPEYRLAGSQRGQGLGAYARAKHLCHPRRRPELSPRRLQARLLPWFAEMVA